MSDLVQEIHVGDVVAVRGDLRLRMDGSCQYPQDQLALGKYIKHQTHGGIWTGVVEKIKGDMVRVGGGWRGIEGYEKLLNTRGDPK